MPRVEAFTRNFAARVFVFSLGTSLVTTAWDIRADPLLILVDMHLPMFLGVFAMQPAVILAWTRPFTLYFSS